MVFGIQIIAVYFNRGISGNSYNINIPIIIVINIAIYSCYKIVLQTKFNCPVLEQAIALIVIENIC